MKRLFPLLILLLLVTTLAARNWNQYYFCFEMTDKAELRNLSKIISIDNIKGNWVYAYANDDEWKAFTELGFNTRLLPSPASQSSPVMSSRPEQTRLWDSYPTYESYVSTMYAFASAYPDLCQIVDAGTTVNGRKILFAKISDNVGSAEAEPEVLYTGTIHGDETTGFILLLRLIDTLLSGYGTDPRLTALVNDLEIWISPNTNPDGTYYGGNSSVSGARRYNANGIDLNRNYPNADGSPNSGAIQVETQALMNFANAHHFVLAANYHGGAEVVNYPWDYTYTLHPDNNWWISTSLVYANSAQANGPAGYFTGISSNGITNGAVWYVIAGGRQDWMNYTAHCRELTLEISNTKLPDASLLPNYWNYNYNAMLSLMEQAYYGIHGTVSDPFGNPLAATITVNGHDNSFSTVISDPAQGDFYRFLSPGTYDLTISADGYPDKVISGVVVNANTMTPLSVVLGELPHVQNLSLQAGWNLVSFNIGLGTNGFADIFDAELQQLKNTTQSYSPMMADHFNNLESPAGGKGYWVNCQNAATLSIEGELLDPAAQPQNLNPGWNLVSYLPDTVQSVSTAFSAILPNILEIRSMDAYWTPSGGSLSLVEPGKAYWVNTGAACTLIYP